MAQEVYVVENQTFPSARTDINNIYLAIATNNSGASAPGTTYQYQWWFDESTNILKQRNGANSAWINMARLVGSVMVPIGSNTLSYADESDSCPTTDWLKESADGWEARVAAAGTGTAIAAATELRLTTTQVTWGTPDSQDSETVDTSVAEWVGADGRFEVKKAGKYKWGYTIVVRFDSTGSNNLDRARVDMFGYHGTNGDQLLDTAYSLAPSDDAYFTDKPNRIVTLSASHRYLKTTTGTTEYVFPTITANFAGATAITVESMQVWCKLVRRDEA